MGIYPFVFISLFGVSFYAVYNVIFVWMTDGVLYRVFTDFLGYIKVNHLRAITSEEAFTPCAAQAGHGLCPAAGSLNSLNLQHYIARHISNDTDCDKHIIFISCGLQDQFYVTSMAHPHSGWHIFLHEQL
ncbi:hypothetical protein ACJX0J_020316, partial [Zea mays]